MKNQRSNYYSNHFQDYHERTFHVDPSPFLIKLVHSLQKGVNVLDIGCGSGRDLLWLKMHGYDATGLERSPNLAQLARKNSGCSVIEGDFTVYDFSSLQFDALLLIGSLVHLHYSEFQPMLTRIQKALIVNGLILLTIKEGIGRVTSKDGRVFTLWKSENLEVIFGELGFKILNFSKNISAINSSEMWLNYLLRKKEVS